MRGDRRDNSDAAAPDGSLADFDAAHEALLADRAIQFELRPVPRPEAPPDMSGLLNMAPFFRFLFWIIVALLAAGLLYLIVTRLTGWSFHRRRKDAAAQADPDWRPAEAPARQLLAEADALAAAGRYDEAAHLLLHRSIDDIDERRPATVRPALTSRELAGLPALPASPAQAFAGIVRTVERSLFAGRRLGADDWRDCRAAYERFAFADAWRR